MPETHLVERFAHVNTVLVDDVTRSLITTARRLLEYERYLDGLEHLKMRDASLPTALERHVARSIQGNLADAQTAGRLVLELAHELEDRGCFESLFSSIDQAIEPGSLPALLREWGPVLEDWLGQRGMPSETWRWALQYGEWDDVGARVERDSIVVTQGKRTLAVITGARDASADAASFVARAYGFPRGTTGMDTGDAPIRLSALEALETAVQKLLTFYGGRARRTALDGVQVLPTGIWWVIVVLIVAAILIAVGGTITIFCAIGTVRDKTVCDVGLALLIVGFMVLLAGANGANTSSPDPNDPEPGTGEFDPPG